MPDRIADDLTFYPARERGANWVTLPVQSEAWLWMPGTWTMFHHNLPSLDDLIAAGWEDIGPLTQLDAALWVLCGQLADIRLTFTGSGDEYPDGYEIWTPTPDRERIGICPVLLAFTISPDQQKQAKDQGGVLKTFTTRRALPPANLGEIAFILTVQNDKPRWLRCKLTLLGIEGQRLQERMGRALDQLAKTDKGREDWLAAWREIQEMARTLAADYWALYRSQSDDPPPPVSPMAFKAASAEAPINMPLLGAIMGIQNAASGAPDWKQAGPDETPYYTHKYSKGLTMLSLKQPDKPAINDTALQSLWERVGKMKDVDADVLMALFAHWANNERTTQGALWIMPEVILQYRGVEPIRKPEEGNRSAGYRIEQRQEIGDAIERLGWLWINVQQAVRGKRTYVRQSRLIEIKERWVQPPLFEDEHTRGRAWLYMPGTWIEGFDAGGEVGRQFGHYFQQVLKYDPRNHEWEKRLARYFTFHLRIAAGYGSKTIRRTIGDLLKECSLEIDQRYSQRGVDRFKKAMDTLAADGIIANWHYVEDLGQLPARNWLEIWQGYNVQVSIGALMVEAGYEAMVERQAKRKELAEHAASLAIAEQGAARALKKQARRQQRKQPKSQP